MCHLFDRSARAVIFIYSSDGKTQLGRRCWDLASCQISLNPVKQFQRRSKKCLSQSWAIAAIFFLLIGPKNTDLVKDVKILLPVKFRRILFSGFREEVENVSANQRPGRPSYFSDLPEKHRLSRGHRDLARLRRKAMRDYQESVTTGQTDRHASKYRPYIKIQYNSHLNQPD